MEKYLIKASNFKADAIILDLEDSVPLAFKDRARINIRNFLERGAYKQQVYVRLNSIDSGLLTEDLSCSLHENTTGFMLTKIDDEKDIIYFDKLLTQLEIDNKFEIGSFKLCPLIETSSAVLRIYEIAKASSRITALAFGGEDYLTDLDGLHKDHGMSLIVPRNLIVIAARAAKVDAIDTPYLKIRDMDGFEKEVLLARELGFSGSMTIHPSQIDIANKIYTPTEEEYIQAKRIVEAIKETSKKGLGVAMLDGQLIGPPMEKRAQNLIKKMKSIVEL